ncbi:MAG: hypothetical protein IKT82_05775 [Bacteroidaceae bacterium]|nr:hypothetical protein [Bacteroidaceae bacterium]
MNTDLEISRVMSDSMELFKKSWVKLTAIMLAMMVAVWVVSFLCPFQVPYDATPEELLEWYAGDATSFYLWQLIPGVVQMCFIVLIYKEALATAKDVNINVTGKMILKFVVVSFIVGVASYVSFLFCIIPFFFIAPRLLIAPLYVIDRPEIGIGEAIERSWKATEGNVMALLGIGIIAILIACAGVLCCLIGIIPAVVFTYLMVVVVYLHLSGQDGTTPPPSEDYEESFVMEEKTVCRD